MAITIAIIALAMKKEELIFFAIFNRNYFSKLDNTNVC